MTENSGLKVGLGVTALGAASAYATPKMVDKAVKVGANALRQQIKSNNAVLTNMGKTGQTANKYLYEAANTLFNFRKAVKSINFLRPLMVAIPLYLGCGAIVDWANKKQRAKNAPNATTKNGNDYTKVNMGKKLGAALALATGTISALANKSYMKKLLSATPNKALTMAIVAVNMAVGGFLMGALTDKISNKKAAKEADKAAM